MHAGGKSPPFWFFSLLLFLWPVGNRFLPGQQQYGLDYFTESRSIHLGYLKFPQLPRESENKKSRGGSSSEKRQTLEISLHNEMESSGTGQDKAAREVSLKALSAQRVAARDKNAGISTLFFSFYLESSSCFVLFNKLPTIHVAAYSDEVCFVMTCVVHGNKPLTGEN